MKKYIGLDVGNCRRELLDHVIAINSSHIKRLLASYIDYYHQDRTIADSKSRLLTSERGAQRVRQVVSWPRVGGLHHRYEHAA